MTKFFNHLYNKRSKLDDNRTKQSYTSYGEPLLSYIEAISSESNEIDKLSPFVSVFVQKYNNKDVKSIIQFISKYDGKLFNRDEKLNVCKIPIENTCSTDKNITSVGKNYIFKRYRSSRIIDDDTLYNDFINEVVYGGYLTYKRPDMFCGVVSFKSNTNVKLVPFNKDSIDIFELYNRELTKKPTIGISKPLRKRITLQMIEIVRTMHKMGFIHNDIKLENTIYNETTKRVQIIDFENTECLKYKHQHEENLYGTFAYGVPGLFNKNREHKLGRSTWTDCYALSVCCIGILFSQQLPGNLEPKSYDTASLLKIHSKRKRAITKLEHEILTDIIEFDLFKLSYKYFDSFRFLDSLRDFITSI